MHSRKGKRVFPVGTCLLRGSERGWEGKAGGVRTEEKQGTARCPAGETTGPRAEKKMVSQALEVSMCTD